ncbi:hypothetical protein A2856_03490 [Candidatus Uhrbacteria bacterium RIFCSPHIGHO2_01_FULL_63_20]|uniref:SHSP domain-containing protein n=1 Tax=Candidatus Uhrbacteria bacterium RIFCSPHIGHO2_01_FULL_63_20 TaxID=1802385 RepID=A0A1F7TJV0_9BACT|nr:MAG: hypothetical protein A2856_03490 [Candidatus Uhrbacteria bacterium RIFCSPHIGHO2_01_FULL_63_20]
MSDQEYLNALAQTVLKSEEGQLSVDVIETPVSVVIRSAIAGLDASDLDVNVTHDTVTIRGTRHHHQSSHPEEIVHVQECFWGTFSRSVVLPCRVKGDEADAAIRNGILTITLPKAEPDGRIPVVDLNV